jgi:hypothetical protein
MRAGTGTGTAFTHSRTFKEYLTLTASVRMKTADTLTASTVKRVNLSRTVHIRWHSAGTSICSSLFPPIILVLMMMRTKDDI